MNGYFYIVAISGTLQVVLIVAEDIDKAQATATSKYDVIKYVRSFELKSGQSWVLTDKSVSYLGR